VEFRQRYWPLVTHLLAALPKVKYRKSDKAPSSTSHHLIRSVVGKMQA
jgi:hypothetical protein